MMIKITPAEKPTVEKAPASAGDVNQGERGFSAILNKKIPPKKVLVKNADNVDKTPDTDKKESDTPLQTNVLQINQTVVMPHAETADEGEKDRDSQLSDSQVQGAQPVNPLPIGQPLLDTFEAKLPSTETGEEIVDQQLALVTEQPHLRVTEKNPVIQQRSDAKGGVYAPTAAMEGENLQPAPQKVSQFTSMLNQQVTEPEESSVTSIKVHDIDAASLTGLEGIEVSLPTSMSSVASFSVTPDISASSGALPLEMGTPGWQQSLGQQIACFTRDGVHHAELRLHPEELGSLQINLRLNNDQAQLHFVTASHQVRAAIEAAVPHLRSSLAESGINLGQSSVGADASSSWNDSSLSGQTSRQNLAGKENGEQGLSQEERTEIPSRTVICRSGVNTFA